MAEKFIIVHRSYDPILIDHLGEMLREAGIVARVIGTRDAALIGVGPSINELHISVPAPQAAEATDFLSDFFETSGEERLEEEGLLYDDDDDEDEDDDEDDDGRDRHLSPTLAGVAVLFCGLGHVYARRRVTGALLAATFVVTLVALPALEDLTGLDMWDGAAFTLFVLIFADLIGGQFAVRSHNRGIVRGRVVQLGFGALYIAIALAASQIPNLGKPLADAIQPTHSFGDIERAIERRESQQNDWIDPSLLELDPDRIAPLLDSLEPEPLKPQWQ